MKKPLSRPGSNADSGPEASRLTVAVEAMGARGDGVARIEGKTVHIPFALPGEIVVAGFRAGKVEAAAIEQASPDRVAPVCKHFGACGGCSLQHWREASYAGWKASLVTTALAREGLDTAIEPLKTYPLASRRRATFTAHNRGGRVQLGYIAVGSHDLSDLTECPIVLPRIASALPQLREALTGALADKGEAKVHIVAAENGLDCNIEGPRLPAHGAAQLIQLLPAAGIVRAAWNGEAVFLKAAPFITAGGVKAALPAGAFLQAVEACERDMAAFAGEALAGMKAEKGPVCDLFAGLGAFTFPCAARAPVTAFEGSADAVASLNAAAKGAHGIKPVKALRRDLFRNPVGPVELNAFAAAVIDPSREGAEAQCRAIAASKIGAVVMLSCNPATFARDAALLTAGGFTLSRLAAFDQFKFSPHVEIAAAFTRAGSKKGRLAPALKRR
jgi:23S rRNA (uracil1939-C5)-methyltransferase